ncbi:MAG TPA: S41 family peptidase [Candidatus Omnitrophota bacterium]|nr:S41 family peptidase [Candidatus Omnitrophota bacterium]HPD85279.1 S41 family peptidase [Candidatus Omnitrophota bacterium]HRZ04220.1 S41 family peptidase [Candidatus Omnitrophota bacterium]
MFKKFLVFCFVVLAAFSLTRFAVSQVPGAETTTGTQVPGEQTITGTQAAEKPVANVTRAAKDDLYSQIELFSYALTTIQSEYTEEPKPKDLIYGSLKGMLASLDPHSQFLDPEDFKELKTETQGKFGGLGIEISIRDGLLTVITPIEDTPAWKAGIKAGDKIVKIGDEITKDITMNDAVKKLRGKPGTQVKITILREDDLKIHNFTITREIIHVQDVKDTQILQDKIGYVRLTEFREESYTEFRKALDLLKSQGADSLILDLRNNPGGLLNVAIKITEEFLPAGKMIVSTKGRRESQNSEAKSANSSPDFVKWPMVVLINEGSASGSEILAGALQDNKRAVIVGMKSFGKGSVQSVIPLPDGSGLRLTTSKYFTPSGKSIHGIGIIPDIEIKREFRKLDPEAQQLEDIEKAFDEVESKDVKSASDPEAAEKIKKEQDISKKLLDDNQVQCALQVIKGIRVYRSMAGN